MEGEQKVVSVSCPSRIDFTGGFTDVMPFRATQWVSHVNLAIDLPVEVVIEHRDDGLIALRDNHDHAPVLFALVDEIEERFSLVKAALGDFAVDSGITVSVNSHAPQGAGLGTSGALSVALVAALMLFTGRTLPDDKSEIAMLAAEIERMSGTLGGLQDQFAAVVGGLNLFQFYGLEHSSKRIELSDRLKKELEENIFILYPGGDRRSTDVVVKVMREYTNGNLTVGNALLSLNELAIEIKKSLEFLDWARLSFLLHEVREQQLTLHPDLIDDGNLRIINNLSEMGIEGVKLLGGGGCGACLLVVSEDSVLREAIINFCDVHYVDIIPVKCASRGLEAKISDSISLTL
ncbi:MAG: hypothetical protein ABIH36_03650 [bacterium]